MGASCSSLSPGCGCREKIELSGGKLLERDARHVTREAHSVADLYEVFSTSRTGMVFKASQGCVYRAKHKKTGAWRAAKQVLKKDLNAEAWANELAVYKQVDHPHVCRLYETFAGGDSVCQIIELCLGKSLFEFAHADRFRPPENFSGLVLRQATSAVAHLHNLGYCHLEVSPEVFMFTQLFAGRSPALRDICLKLVDLGQALKMDEDGSVRAKPTPALSNNLAVHCKAPELCHQRHAPQEPISGPSCDVWSLGVMTFFVITGSWPIVGPNGISAANTKAEQEWKLCSRRGQHFVHQCLKKESSKRPRGEELLGSSWLETAQAAYVASMEQGATGKTTASAVVAPTMTPEAVVEGFRAVQKLNPLEHAVLTIAVHHLPEEKTAHQRRVFAMLDKDGNGRLTVNELVNGLGQAFDSLGTAEDIKSALDQIDTDGNRLVDYTEFLVATFAARQNVKDDVCYTAFAALDQDGGGYVCVKELQQAFGDAFDPHASNLLGGHDADGNGLIDFEEFKVLLRGEERASHSPYATLKTSTPTNRERNDSKKRSSPRSKARAKTPEAKEGKVKADDSGEVAVMMVSGQSRDNLGYPSERSQVDKLLSVPKKAVGAVNSMKNRIKKAMSFSSRDKIEGIACDPEETEKQTKSSKRSKVAQSAKQTLTKGASFLTHTVSLFETAVKTRPGKDEADAADDPNKQADKPKRKKKKAKTANQGT